MKYLLLYIIVLLSFQGSVFSQPKVAVTVDSTEVQIGDYIHFRIEIIHDSSTEVFFPAIADSIKPFEMIKSEEPVITLSDPNVAKQYDFTIAGYDSGDITLPSFLIPYKGPQDTAYNFVATDSIVVTVHSLPVVLEEDIEDIKEPLLLPMDWRLMALYAGIGLLLLLLAYYFYRRIKKKRSEAPVEKPKPARPSYIVAMEKLEALEEKQLWQRGEVKAYHSEITGIIRGYFEERFSFNALEMTTNEILRMLRNSAAGKGVLQATKEFLYSADLVKFAKFEPEASLNEQMMNQAREIVEQTKKQELKERSA